jgi:hypothetical protein
MCSLYQQIIDSPARPKRKSLLRGDLERLSEAVASSDASHTFRDETRDDEPIVGNNHSTKPSSRHSLSSVEHLSIPFAKTFAVAESYRKSSPRQMTLSSTTTFQSNDSTATLQQQHPLRRRARSSEGTTLHKLHSEGHQYTASLDQHELTRQETFKMGATFPPSQHFFSPAGANTQGTLRQRKSTTGKSGRTPTSEPGSAKNSILSNRQSQHRFKGNKHKQRGKSAYVIPMEHPFKVIWDLLTVILSIAHGYLTHVAIRDRQFGISPFVAFCNAWFLMDILLNFVTERKTSTGDVLRDHRSIVARYLTSWFAVDALSLFPWECLYMKPLVELQNRRGILKKSFFRSKAVVRVTRHLRGRHFRWFGTVARHTKQHGIGGQRLLRLLIKYLPKYFMFLRNMKAIVAIRLFRYIHWGRRFFYNIQAQNDNTAKVPKSTQSDDDTKSLTTREAEDDSLHGLSDDDGDDLRNMSVEVVYDDWKMHFNNDSYYDDDDDDGVPL